MTIPTIVHQPVASLRANTKISINTSLARLHVLQGPSGTGKTSHREAIEIAINASRGAKRGHVSKLSPDGSPVYSYFAIPGLFEASYHENDGHTVNVATGVQKPIVVSPSSWLISMGPGKTRAEIVARWASDLTSYSPGPGLPPRSILQAPPELSTEQASLWSYGVTAVQTIIDNYNKKHPEDSMSSDPSTILAELVSWARKQKLAEGRAATALSEAVSVARASLEKTGPQTVTPDGQRTSLVSSEDMARLETMLALAEEGERQMPQILQTRARTTQRHEQLARDIERFNHDFAAFQALTLPDESKVPGLTKSLEDIRTVYTEGSRVTEIVPPVLTLVDSSPVNCPVCLATYDQAKAQNRFRDALKLFTDQMDNIKKQLKQSEDAFSRHNQEVHNYEAKKTALNSEYVRITAETQEVTKLVASMPSVYEGEPSHDIRPRLAAARALNAAKDAVNAQEVEYHRHENAKVVAQRVEQAAGLVLKRLTDTIAERVKVATTPHLPPELRDRFVCDLDGFAMIGADGRPHARTEQSGAELTALKLALAKAWASGGPYILCLDYKEDLADFDGYGGLENALKTIETQALGDPNCLLVLLTTPVALPVSSAWYVQLMRPGLIVTHSPNTREPATDSPPALPTEAPPPAAVAPSTDSTEGTRSVPATRSMMSDVAERMKQDAADAADGIVTDEDVQADPVPKKRGPGRPRKNPPKAAPSTKGRSGR